MIFKGDKLRNSINGLTAIVEDITNNGVFVLSTEAIYLGFSSICEKPFIGNERITIDTKSMQKYIDIGTWEVVK